MLEPKGTKALCKQDYVIVKEKCGWAQKNGFSQVAGCAKVAFGVGYKRTQTIVAVAPRLAHFVPELSLTGNHKRFIILLEVVDDNGALDPRTSHGKRTKKDRSTSPRQS